jgi:hypothetical protein
VIIKWRNTNQSKHFSAQSITVDCDSLMVLDAMLERHKNGSDLLFVSLLELDRKGFQF